MFKVILYHQDNMVYHRDLMYVLIHRELQKKQISLGYSAE